MSGTVTIAQDLLRRSRAAAALRRAEHGSKVLLGFGGAAITLSALSMAHALATPIQPVIHDPRALAALGYGVSSAGGPRFIDSADRAVLTLVKAYNAAATPTSTLFGLNQLVQSSPAIAPQAYRQLTPQTALAINASIPFSSLPNPAARPFKIDAADVTDHARALDCLTAAVYYEAASESEDGQAAVAQVVLNRLRHPLFPKTVCGVVYQGSELPTGCQFTFTCDGSLGRKPNADAWKRAEKVAERALGGYVMKQVGEATHYHTQYVVPYWQPTVTKLTQIGAHIFYRWSGGMGSPEAFHGQYAGFESPPSLVNGLDAQIVAAPAPAVMTVASAELTSQPVVALVRADRPSANGGAASASAPGAAAEAVAETPRLAPEVKATLAAPAPRASFFGHGAGDQAARTSW